MIFGGVWQIGKPPHLMVGWVMFTSLLWSLVQPYILPDSHRLDTGRGSSRGGWYHSRLDLHWQGPLQELTQHEWHGEMVLWSQKVATACVNYEPLLCIRGSIPLSAGVISGFFLKSSFLAFPFKAFLALHNSLHDTTTSLLYNYNNHTYWHGMNFYQISVCAYVRIHLVVFPFPFPNTCCQQNTRQVAWSSLSLALLPFWGCFFVNICALLTPCYCQCMICSWIVYALALDALTLPVITIGT